MKKQASTSRDRGVPRSGEARDARSARIAPTVQRFLGECEAFGLAEDDVAAFKREVRALLAVARLGRRLVHEDPDSHGDLRINGGDWELIRKFDDALARAGKSRGDVTNE